MEEFEYKLGRNNPVVVANTVKLLTDKIRELSTGTNRNEYEKHFKYLLNKCLYGNNCVSTTAILAVVALCEDTNFDLTIDGVLRDFMVAVSNTLNLNGLIQLVFHKLKNANCTPYGIMVNQHPLISILMKNGEVWSTLLTNIDGMLIDNQCFAYFMSPNSFLFE